MQGPAQGAPFKAPPPLFEQVGNGKKKQFHTFFHLLNSHHGAFSTGTSLACHFIPHCRGGPKISSFSPKNGEGPGGRQVMPYYLHL
jgi:hypothetical protein